MVIAGDAAQAAAGRVVERAPGATRVYVCPSRDQSSSLAEWSCGLRSSRVIEGACRTDAELG